MTRKPRRGVLREAAVAWDAAPRAQTRQIAAGAFKTHCLELMDDVAEKHLEIVITKHGKPVCKLVPVDQGAGDPFGYLSGSIASFDDPTGPTGEDWEADG